LVEVYARLVVPDRCACLRQRLLVLGPLLRGQRHAEPRELPLARTHQARGVSMVALTRGDLARGCEAVCQQQLVSDPLPDRERLAEVLAGGGEIAEGQLDAGEVRERDGQAVGVAALALDRDRPRAALRRSGRVAARGLARREVRIEDGQPGRVA